MRNTIQGIPIARVINGSRGKTHLATEHAGVSAVLGDLDLLDLLADGSTVASTVLACHSDLLRALAHGLHEHTDT